MTYSEKLKDPRWQRKRLEIMGRDSFMCLRCKSEKLTLHVHHKRYVRDSDPWDYPDENFETLCQSCHAGHHGVVVEAEHKPAWNWSFTVSRHMARGASSQSYKACLGVIADHIANDPSGAYMLGLATMIAGEFGIEPDQVLSDYTNSRPAKLKQ